MSIIEIRESDARDSDSVAELSATAFGSLRTIYRPTGEAVQRQEQCRQQETRIVAEMSGQMVGTVGVAFHRDFPHLAGLAVHPDFQRMGIARAMIDWIGSRVGRRQHRMIVLDTIRETGNVAIFERMGFEVVSEKVAEWCVSEQFEQLHEVTMAKKLPDRESA